MDLISQSQPSEINAQAAGISESLADHSQQIASSTLNSTILKAIAQRNELRRKLADDVKQASNDKSPGPVGRDQNSLIKHDEATEAVIRAKNRQRFNVSTLSREIARLTEFLLSDEREVADNEELNQMLQEFELVEPPVLSKHAIAKELNYMTDKEERISGKLPWKNVIPSKPPRGFKPKPEGETTSETTSNKRKADDTQGASKSKRRARDTTGVDTDGSNAERPYNTRRSTRLAAAADTAVTDAPFVADEAHSADEESNDAHSEGQGEQPQQQAKAVDLQWISSQGNFNILEHAECIVDLQRPHESLPADQRYCELQCPLCAGNWCVGTKNFIKGPSGYSIHLRQGPADHVAFHTQWKNNGGNQAETFAEKCRLRFISPDEVEDIRSGKTTIEPIAAVCKSRS